ncbi:SPW repeat protein [Mesorhizobium sp. VK24D]|uniref:SPW repeat protein n=1 Tax=Mesorhizobium album TaxID=3072314 RepID=A0ABU4Y746_9HYPH|nr:SPW repeat protein [Mesorhizobium sp. VK24D]MDX8482757.1 SPW repeat protein [Mesorhizobium sp. VK24D]
MASKLMEERKSKDWVTLVLAICLFISPWVIGFTAAVMPAWNAWIVGVLLGALALATLSVFAEWEEWVNLVLGLWLIVSPWVLHFAADRNVMITHVVLGVLVVAASAWAVWDVRHPHAHA